MITQLYDKIKDKILPLKADCDSSQIEISCGDTGKVKVVMSQRSDTDYVVDIKKKCKFCGLFDKENSFMWHVTADKDVELLIDRLKKIQRTTIEDGPYDFSRRSTYIKKQNKVSVAMSGNFVKQAEVINMVVIGDGGLLLEDLSKPDRKPWFFIKISADPVKKSVFGGKTDKSKYIIYDMENYWPVAVNYGTGGMWSMRSPTEVTFRATSVLGDTAGKLLTMHDKFVVDLAVKLSNENRE